MNHAGFWVLLCALSRRTRMLQTRTPGTSPVRLSASTTQPFNRMAMPWFYASNRRPSHAGFIVGATVYAFLPRAIFHLATLHAVQLDGASQKANDTLRSCRGRPATEHSGTSLATKQQAANAGLMYAAAGDALAASSSFGETRQRPIRSNQAGLSLFLRFN